MEEKPASIRRRSGFVAAVVDAADRILAAEAKAAQHRIAAMSKFAILHSQALLGNQEADTQLAKFVEKMKGSSDKTVAKEVRFLQLERRIIEADKLELDKIPDVLDEAKEFCTEEKLIAKHLRLASNIVRAINRLDSDDPEKKQKLGDKREEYFKQFGELFAKSKNKQLARYGSNLAKPKSKPKPTAEKPGVAI